MRLLVLTSRLPFPPDRGDRLRTWQFLRSFADEHAVTLVTFITNQSERQQASELEPFCEEIYLVPRSRLASVTGAALTAWRDLPLQALYYQSREMSQTIDRLVATRNFDAAYIHLFRMAPYMSGHKGLYRIADLTDLISLELEASLPYQNAVWRNVYRFELPRIVNYEQQVAAWSNEVWFISKRDLDSFTARSSPAQLHVVPNTVDEALFDVKQAAVGPPRLLFLGNLEVKHNIDAICYLLRDIMPLIWEDVPDCELRIVGAGDPHAVTGLNQYPKVQFAGYVHDLGGEFATSTISVAPLRFSAGVQNKVVEAMAAGLPVVTTGAVSTGLGTSPECDLLVGDDQATFHTQVVRLLQDASLRRQLGETGRTYAREKFTSYAAAERLRRVAELIGHD